jgi:energy-coupling factor transporter ATP-binding protein EcfA2
VTAQSAIPPALEARSLYRFYRAGDEETLAVQGVSLRLERGEFVAVTGTSGSCKSTLLACLAGMDKPDGGSVRIAGRRISHRPEPQRTRSGPATSACSFRTPTCSRDSGSSKALSVLSVGRYHSGAIDVWPPQPNQIAGRRVTLRPARKLSLTGPAGRKTGAALGRAVAGSLFFRHRLCCRFESTAMGPQNPASVGRPSAALFRHGTRRREPVVTRCDLTD